MCNQNFEFWNKMDLFEWIAKTKKNVFDIPNIETFPIIHCNDDNDGSLQYLSYDKQ